MHIKCDNFPNSLTHKFSLEYQTQQQNTNNIFVFHKGNVSDELHLLSNMLTIIISSTDKAIIGLELSDSLCEKHLRNIVLNILKSFKNDKNSNIYISVNKSYKEDLKYIIDIFKHIYIARKIAILPANIGTPDLIAKELKELFKGIKGVKKTYLTHKDLVKKKLNLICSIGDSAKNPPGMLLIEKKSKNPSAKTICFIGKGITFDSGGLSIKPIKSMMDMKYDKIGAIYSATCMKIILEDPLSSSYNIIGAFPLAENAVSDKAVRPGDVIVSHSGKTVEITDPDAEGRLVLADAISYVSKYKPSLIIDMATLTGHSEIINCFHKAYYYCNEDKMRRYIEKQSYNNGERMIAMPNWEEIPNVLTSPVADLTNLPRKCRDAYIASLFLKEFIPENADWIHFDLAHEVIDEMPKGHSIITVVDTVKEWMKK